jgi:competence protein ComEA
VLAQRIVDYRKAHGHFKRIEQLQEVEGIGPKKFADLKAQVYVEPVH